PGAAATAVAGMITGHSRAPTVAPAAAPTTTGTTVLLDGLPGMGWAAAASARTGAAISVDAITAAVIWDFMRRLLDRSSGPILRVSFRAANRFSCVLFISLQGNHAPTMAQRPADARMRWASL